MPATVQFERVFPVVEHFVSVNGEGTHAGRLAAFVRFRGCTLACAYCDTVWANRADAPAQMMSVREIISFVEASPASCVTLTGGEPLLQDGIEELIEALLADPDRFVEIETNGAVPLAYFADVRQRLVGEACGRLSFTMDCKDDFPVVLETIDRYGLQDRCQVYLSPVFDQMDPARIVDFMKDSGLDRATLQLQLHKIVWPDAEKGV